MGLAIDRLFAFFVFFAVAFPLPPPLPSRSRRRAAYRTDDRWLQAAGVIRQGFCFARDGHLADGAVEVGRCEQSLKFAPPAITENCPTPPPPVDFVPTTGAFLRRFGAGSDWPVPACRSSLRQQFSPRMLMAIEQRGRWARPSPCPASKASRPKTIRHTTAPPAFSVVDLRLPEIRHHAEGSQECRGG